MRKIWRPRYWRWQIPSCARQFYQPWTLIGLCYSELPTWLYPFRIVYGPNGIPLPVPFSTTVQSVDDEGNIWISSNDPVPNSRIRCVLHELEPIGSVWWNQEAVYFTRKLFRPHCRGFLVTVTVHVEGDLLHVKLACTEELLLHVRFSICFINEAR